MSPLTRLLEQLREGFEGLGESLAGSRAQRVLESEIRALDDSLLGLRAELASLKARRVLSVQHQDALAVRVQHTEAQALDALRAADTRHAHELAGVIAALEQDRALEAAMIQQLDARIAQRQQDIETAHNAMRRLRHQLDTLRAAEQVQQAQASVAREPRAGRPRTALDAVLRMRAHADGHGASTTAADAPLPNDPHVHAVIERLRAQITPQPDDRPEACDE